MLLLKRVFQSLTVSKRDIMSVVCPHCGKSRGYLVHCPNCGWIGCEKELRKGTFNSECPNCGGRVTSGNRVRDQRTVYRLFGDFYCRNGRGMW